MDWKKFAPDCTTLQEPATSSALAHLATSTTRSMPVMLIYVLYMYEIVHVLGFELCTVHVHRLLVHCTILYIVYQIMRCFGDGVGTLATVVSTIMNAVVSKASQALALLGTELPVVGELWPQAYPSRSYYHLCDLSATIMAPTTQPARSNSIISSIETPSRALDTSGSNTDQETPSSSIPSTRK